MYERMEFLYLFLDKRGLTIYCCTQVALSGGKLWISPYCQVVSSVIPEASLFTSRSVHLLKSITFVFILGISTNSNPKPAQQSKAKENTNCKQKKRKR